MNWVFLIVLMLMSTWPVRLGCVLGAYICPFSSFSVKASPPLSLVECIACIINCNISLVFKRSTCSLEYVDSIVIVTHFLIQLSARFLTKYISFVNFRGLSTFRTLTYAVKM